MTIFNHFIILHTCFYFPLIFILYYFFCIYIIKKNNIALFPILILNIYEYTNMKQIFMTDLFLSVFFIIFIQL